jgi:hypothetical protein
MKTLSSTHFASTTSILKFSLAMLCSSGLLAWAGPESAAKKAPVQTSKAAPTTKAPQRRKVGAGLQITVEKYDASVDAFWVISNSAPDYGPLYVAPEDLVKGIEFEGDLKTFMRRPSDIVGTVYQLKHDVPVLRYRDMYERGKKLGTIK